VYFIIPSYQVSIDISYTLCRDKYFPWRVWKCKKSRWNDSAYERFFHEYLEYLF